MTNEMPTSASVEFNAFTRPREKWTHWPIFYQWHVSPLYRWSADWSASHLISDELIELRLLSNIDRSLRNTRLCTISNKGTQDHTQWNVLSHKIQKQKKVSLIPFKSTILCVWLCAFSCVHARALSVFMNRGGWKGKLKRSERAAWFNQTVQSLDLPPLPPTSLYVFQNLFFRFWCCFDSVQPTLLFLTNLQQLLL